MKFYILIMKIFKNALCVYALILFLAYLLRKSACKESRNINNKICIVIKPVEQSL